MSALVPSAGAAVRPVISEVDGRPLAESRDVAARFGKRHGDVLRSIDLLIATAPGCERNFAFSSAPRAMPNGGAKEERFCLMDRDGFAILAMGFTGSKAVTWKLDYIAAFNAMEEEIRRRTAVPAFDPHDAATMRSYLIHFTGQLLEAQAQTAAVRQELVVTTERTEDAEAEVTAVRPKVEFYDAFADADGLYGLHNAARAIGAPPQGFVEWLKKGHLFYQDRELMPKATFITLCIFEVKVRLVDEKARSRTYVTPRGLQQLAKAWQRHLLKTGKAPARTLFDVAS